MAGSCGLRRPDGPQVHRVNGWRAWVNVADACALIHPPPASGRRTRIAPSPACGRGLG
ncbi:hypothetical protein [Lysobacter gummosus]|uniref:hypothetical protein n=1 Tax=Lysobacter gummosus TaxID=262324 RepID=UPI0036281905